MPYLIKTDDWQLLQNDGSYAPNADLTQVRAFLTKEAAESVCPSGQHVIGLGGDSEEVVDAHD